MLPELSLTLDDLKVKGDELPRDGPYGLYVHSSSRKSQLSGI